MFNKVQIIQVTAQGFRGYEKSYTFQMDTGNNEFIGDNGEGKSSLGEVISWILSGRNIEGKQKELNIVNKNSDHALGRLVFRDEFGKIHEVERRLSSSTTIKYNMAPISQKKLDEIIPAELFLSIFNPIYFLNLDKEASRKTLLSLIPTITKEDVLAGMNAYEKEFLEKESFGIHDTNTYLKNRREEVKDIEENKKRLEGYMEKLQEKIEVPAERKFNDEPVLKLQDQLDKLTQLKPVLKSMEDVLKQKNEIQKELSSVQHMPFQHIQLRSELLQEQALLKQQLTTEQQKEYTAFNPSELNTKLSVLRNDYKHVLTSSNEIDKKVMELSKKHVHMKEGETCPYCKQSISKQALDTLNNELQKEVNVEKNTLNQDKVEKKKTLSELEAEGKRLVAEIESSKKADDQKRIAFDKAKSEAIVKIENRLKEIDKYLVKVAEEEKSFEESKKTRVSQLQSVIDSLGVVKLEEENAKIQADFNVHIQSQKAPIQEELQRLLKEKEEVVKYESVRKERLSQKAKQEKDIEKYTTLLEKYNKEQGELEAKIDLMKNFNAKKIEIVNTSISSNLKDVAINIQKVVPSTGEVKDCFDILYSGRELKICSTAETIKAGLEISHMIATLSGKDYPVFIDNRESITNLVSPANQTIEVRVVAGKKLSKLKNGAESLVEIMEPKKKSETSSNPIPYRKSTSA